MTKRFAAIAAVATLGIAGAAAMIAATATGAFRPGDLRPAFTATPWPFPIDPWGTGKAFVCKAADCGTAVTLYLRAKIGFCNCTTGVADDEELERIGDLELVAASYAPSEPGKPIEVARMKGRSRAYDARVSGGSRRLVRSIAFNDRCDVIVATAVINGKSDAAIEPAVLDFLRSDTVMRWAERTLGL